MMIKTSIENLKLCLLELVFYVDALSVALITAVKLELFRLYCMCLYDDSLRCRYTVSAMNKLSLCYSKCLPSFNTLLHKCQLSFKCSQSLYVTIRLLNAGARVLSHLTGLLLIVLLYRCFVCSL